MLQNSNGMRQQTVQANESAVCCSEELSFI